MADIRFYQSYFWNNLDSNGGHFITTTEIADNTSENVHPNVTDTQRTAGVVLYRSPYCHIRSGTANNAIMVIDKTNESEDYFAMAKGVNGSVQSTWATYNASAWIMVGELDSAITAGAASFEVNFASSYGVQNAGKVGLMNWTSLQSDGSVYIDTYTTHATSGVAWTTHKAKIKLATGTVSYNYPIKLKGSIVGSQVAPFGSLENTTLIIDANTVICTITFPNTDTADGVVTTINTYLTVLGSLAVAINTPADQITLENARYYSNNYIQVTGGTARTIFGFSTVAATSTDGTMVSGVIDLGTIATSVSSILVGSTYGQFNYSLYPIGTNKQGCIDEHYVLTFNTTVNYSVSGTRKGAIITGTITGTCAPANNNGGNYFIIQPASFNNSFVAGDTVEWDTSASAVQMVIKRVVPTACPSWGVTRSSYQVRCDQ